MLVFLLIALVVFVAFASMRWERQRQLPASFEPRPHELPAMSGVSNLLGHPVTEEEFIAGTETVGSGETQREIELFRYRQTVHGILPAWVAFGWSRERVSEGGFDRNDLWVELLFDHATLGGLPIDGSIHSSKGDLVFESGRRRRSAFDPIVLALGDVFLTKQLDVREALERAALEMSPRRRAVALRLLVQHFPEGEAAARALAWAAAFEDPELNAIAASVRGDLPVLRALADHPDGPHAALAREEALSAMLRLQDHEGLAALALHPVPAPLIDAYLDSLRKSSDPRREQLALAYLDGAGRVTAVDVLAAIGTRDSVGPLRALLDANPSEEQRVAIEIAIELIQDRITRRLGAERGAMSVAEPSGAGALSSVGTESGALSPAADADD